MKILLINDHYFFGGAENYVEALEEELDEEHEVNTLTLDGAEESDYAIEESSNPLFKLRNRYFSNRKIKRKIQEIVEKVDPDAVHLNKNIVAPIAVLKGLKGKKVVKTVHDFGFVSLEDKYAYDMNNWERKFRKTLDTGTQKYLKHLRNEVIDKYTAPSRALTEELENSNYSRVKHLPNFVSDRKPSYGGEHFLFVGRLEKGKAPDLLVEAYNELEDSEDIPTLEIAGKGKMKEELEEKSSGLDKVTVNGYVSENKLMQLYRDSKAVIVPSRWRENNPLVALEAKAYGSALIVSDQGGLPELVEEGETGFIFESENVEELKNILSKKKEDWEKLGKNSRQDYEQNYRPEVHIEKLLTIYSK